MKNKLLNYSLIGFQVLMIVAVYAWHIAQELSLFDFGSVAILLCMPFVIAILIHAIWSRKWILAGSVVVTGIFFSCADYVTEAYVESQDKDNQARALLIIDDIYTYHEKNGVWPDSLSQATALDREWSLGFWSQEFWYAKKDSTFQFRFPAENSATWHWYYEAQRLGWYD